MIYVMSDIHGMYDKYMKMLDLIKLTENDTLYVIGDVIDRGSGSMKILQDMMKKPNIIGIFGNHELMCVECLKWLTKEITTESVKSLEGIELMSLSDWLNNGAIHTIQEFRQLNKKEQNDIIDYLLEFTAYEEITVNDKDYLLVHAGLGGFRKDKSLEDYDVNDFVWERPNWEIPYYDDPNKFVIVGHTPTPLISGKPQIFYQNNFIAIDCGACFTNGRLACLCLTTMQEFYV